MAKIGSILISWNDQGNITLSYDDGRPNEDGVEEVYALGAAALFDHMLSTISGKNIPSFCLSAIKGLVDNKIDIQPIGAELKRAKIEIHRGQVLYTIFKPETKLFANNQKLEISLIQMTLNTISTLLKSMSEQNRLILRFRGYYIIASYEEIIRKAREAKESPSVARRKIAQVVAYSLNTTPNNLTEEKLNDIFQQSSELILKCNTLPQAEDKPILHF
jgi:hypothetical protein